MLKLKLFSYAISSRPYPGKSLICYQFIVLNNKRSFEACELLLHRRWIIPVLKKANKNLLEGTCWNVNSFHFTPLLLHFPCQDMNILASLGAALQIGNEIRKWPNASNFFLRVTRLWHRVTKNAVFFTKLSWGSSLVKNLKSMTHWSQCTFTSNVWLYQSALTVHRWQCSVDICW